MSEPLPAKVETTPAPPGLSPVCAKPIIARFDGGQLSSDAGVLALREIKSRLGIADRLPPAWPILVRLGVSCTASPPSCGSGCC